MTTDLQSKNACTVTLKALFLLPLAWTPSRPTLALPQRMRL
jgi:hypothetical protein